MGRRSCLVLKGARARRDCKEVRADSAVGAWRGLKEKGGGEGSMLGERAWVLRLGTIFAYDLCGTARANAVRDLSSGFVVQPSFQ